MVYVDFPKKIVSRDPQAKRVGAKHGHQWCHMWADSLPELLEMADRIGMKREWLQSPNRRPHFDLVPTRRAKAVRFGAKELHYATWLKKQLGIKGD